MDYLQYLSMRYTICRKRLSFKPYYKWITFNTITGIMVSFTFISFKPYYKWITFNTHVDATHVAGFAPAVLNLIINGLPSILSNYIRHCNK